MIPQQSDNFFQETLKNLIVNNEIDPNIDPIDLWIVIRNNFYFAIDNYQISLPYYIKLFGNEALAHKEENNDGTY